MSLLVIQLFSSAIINAQVLNQIGRLYIPNTDVPGSENAAIDTMNNRIFVADGYHKSVNSFDFKLNENISTADIKPSKNIFFEAAFINFGFESFQIDDVTCVRMSPKGYILATIVPKNHSIENGWIAFIDPTNQSVFHLKEMEHCFLPDHVTCTSDGNIILVACEGEPSENEEEYPTFDPPGSIGYIDASSMNINDWTYSNIGFEQFDDDDDRLPDDIYLPNAARIFSLCAEPEYIVVDKKDKFAYIALQENNAIAVLDIMNMEILNIFSLGFSYFGSNGGLDASDKDGNINIVEYSHLYGMRQPDAIDYFEFENGRKFLFTANEGDSKGFDESRVKDLLLNEDIFDINYIQSDPVLGRLKVSNLIGRNDQNDSLFDQLYTFSSRDFTVYEIISDEDGIPINISLHFSSNNDFEQITSSIIPNGFNSDYSGGTFDERSDAKGPEPECITIGECENGKLFVFICLERVGGIMVYDFTDINNITFVDYVNNRNFTVIYDNDEIRPPSNAGDIGPEQITFIPQNIYGEALLLVSNPQSTSVTMYKIDCGQSMQKTKSFALYQISFIILIAIVIALIIVSIFVIFLVYNHCKKNTQAKAKETQKQTQKDVQEKKQNAIEETCDHDFILQTGHISSVESNRKHGANNIVFLDDEAMDTMDSMSMVVKNE